MSDRAKAAKRIADVRAQMAKLAEWRRLASEARLAEVESARRALELFVADTQPTGHMAGVALSQARRLSSREQVAASLRDRAVLALQEAEGRLKMAERMAERLAGDDRDRIERRDLERLIESLASGAAASLP